MENKYVAVYGSLRTDMSLYNNLQLKSKVINHGTFKLDGYDMFSLGQYPCIIEGKGEIVIELFEFKDLSSLFIVDLLEQVQYSTEYIDFEVDNKIVKVKIYIFRNKNYTNFLKCVKSGDWVEYNGCSLM